MKKLIILLGLISVFAGLATAQRDQIGERQWKLVSADGVVVPRNTRAYLELDEQKGQFSGNTGCNRMFGAVSVQARRVDFSNVGTTRMACAEPRVMRVESALVRALENVDRYRVRNNTLELLDRNRVVLTFAAVAKTNPRATQLEDMKWTLEAIKGRPVGKLGQSAFIVFDRSKRSAGGNSSCNVYGGNYTATGSTIRITDVVGTMRACIEDNRMNIERDLYDGLRQANRYEIVRDKLMLYRNERLLLTMNGERK
jgi:heat shock protein HslJ